MANILGIKGFNRAGTSVNKLMAAYVNDIVDLSTGSGSNLALNENFKVEFDVFLDRLFFQNYDARPLSFDGTTWTNKYLDRTVRSKYIKSLKSQSRVYLGYCQFTGPQIPLDADGNEITFPSRVFYSDLFIANNLTWGMEWGTNGNVTAGNNLFFLSGALPQNFIANNIKIGDPLVITSGNASLATKTFFVQEIVGPYVLRVTENFDVSASSLDYWVGSNWFDVGPDDNDSITAIEEDTSGNLLISKLFSLFSYNGTNLRQIRDAVGTSSNRSVINTNTGTYYFHGSDPKLSGIYRYDGSDTTRISRPIDPFVQGMDNGQYDDVAVWREGEELRWYLGDLNYTNRNIDMDKAVATYNYALGAWDVSPIKDAITCATPFRFGNENKYYCGNSEGQVLKMGTGTNFNGDPIAFNLETKVFYPSGTEVINEFPRIQVIGRTPKGVSVGYKLWNTPRDVDSEWYSLGELANDKTELSIPTFHKMSSGIQLRFSGIDTLENDMYVEKATIFYNPMRTRML